jgi:hypothetical protein
MARLKKSVLIEELQKLGISFDDNMNYNEMHKLYDESKDNPNESNPVDIPKEERLNAVYEYKPDEGEKLIIDKPSTPISVFVRTDKKIYDDFINSGRNFYITYKGTTVFDSKAYIGKPMIEKLKTHESSYEIHGRSYPYAGSSIHFS